MFRPMARKKQQLIEKEIAATFAHTLVFALVPEHMTGKLVNEA